MNSYYLLTIIILLTNVFSSCSVKSSAPQGTTATSNAGSNPGTTNSNNATTAPGTSSTTNGISCDGINNNGATLCYYKNLPTIQIMGQTSAAISAGTPLWSSLNLDNHIPQQQFVTDVVFNARIIPRAAIKTNPALNPSVPNKTCNNLMTTIATKMRVQLKLQTKEEDASGGVGEVATLSASIDQPSPVWHFQRRPTASNLVLKVVSVLTDSRCQQGGTGYCPYSDLPLNSPTTTAPTECVAFDIQYSTDETYDLPGPSAN